MALPNVRAARVHGREAEQGLIASVFQSVRAGRSGVLVVQGPAGIGKSTLLEDAVQALDDIRVLRACGVESEAELDFAGLHQLLRPVLGHDRELPRHQRRALRIALGLEPGPEDAPGADRFLVALAVLGVLAAGAEKTPVVCLVDDAHWLDHATATTLLFVARRLGAEPIGLVFAVRDPDGHDFSTGDLPGLRLEGLDVDASGALLDECTGAVVDRDVCERLVQWTDGNPLALIELPSVLSPDQLAGRSPLPSPLPLPQAVERLFTERVRRLPDDAATMALVAAAEDSGQLGRVVAAARVLGLPGSALEIAERSGLIAVGPSGVEFSHPLARSAVYQSATTGERRRVHLALQQAADDAGDVDRRAWHAAAAALVADETVVHELEMVAARAASRGGFGAAAAALARAADLSADGTARCRRLLAAAESAWMGSQLNRASYLLDVARPLAEDPLLRADIRRLRGWLEFSVGSPAAAQRILIDAARDVAPSDARRARQMLGAAAESAWLGSDHGAGTDIRPVMATLSPPADVRDRSSADLLSGFLSLLDGNVGEAVGQISGTIRTAEQLGHDDLVAAATQHALYVGDDDAALRLSSNQVARARADGAAADLLFALPRLAHAELLHGRWAAAAVGAAEAVRLATGTDQRELAALPLAWLSLVAALRGSHDTADTHAERLEALAETHALGVFRTPALEIVQWARATEMLASARPASAFALLEGLSHPVVTSLATLDLVEAAVQSGHREAARSWSARMDAVGAATGAPWALAAAAHCRGLLSDGPVALDQFAEALRHHESSRRPFEHGRTSLAYGEVLRRSRRRVDARPHLADALDRFESLGAADWAERARVELRACGETVRKRDPSAALRLTSQELQVARFVAGGLPTRTVAAQLFLSPRTVDFHLRNVFNKLGISSRTELAAQRLD